MSEPWQQKCGELEAMLGQVMGKLDRLSTQDVRPDVGQDRRRETEGPRLVEGETDTYKANLENVNELTLHYEVWFKEVSGWSQRVLDMLRGRTVEGIRNRNLSLPRFEGMPVNKALFYMVYILYCQQIHLQIKLAGHGHQVLDEIA